MYPISSKPAEPVSIRELSKGHLDAAAQVYAQGLLMETPPGSSESLEALVQIMRHHLQSYLLKKNTRQIWLSFIRNHPCGLLDFYYLPMTIRIRFLCAIPPSQGIGTQLMTHLAQFALDNNVRLILTTISSLDQRAMNFYFSHIGFFKTGKRTEESNFDLFLAAVYPKEILLRLNRQSSPD